MADIPTWAQIVSSLLGSGTIGGIVGALVTSFNSRQKFKELDISYQQKAEAAIIANARNHIETLYLPINRSLSHLAEKYEYYKRYRDSYVISKSAIDFSPDISIEDRKIFLQILQKEYVLLTQARQEFTTAGNEYLTLMSETALQGKDAYLTIKLEERLRSFTAFFKPYMLTPLFQEEMEEGASKDKRLRSTIREFAIGAPSFETRFMEDIHDLKSYIKEVTLGGSSK